MKTFTIKINEDIILATIDEKIKTNKIMMIIAFILLLISAILTIAYSTTTIGIIAILLAFALMGIVYYDYQKAVKLKEKVKKGNYKLKFEGSEDSFGDKLYLTFTIE